MAAGNDLAWTKLRSGGFTGALGDMLTAYMRANPTVRYSDMLGPDRWKTYWDAYLATPGVYPANAITFSTHYLTFSGHQLKWS